MELEAAIERIKQDPDLLKRFLASPRAELDALGVDTSKIEIDRPQNEARRRGLCVGVGGPNACVEVGLDY